MPSKLGPHSLRGTQDLVRFPQHGGRLVKLVSHYPTRELLAANPNLLIVGRHYTELTALEQLNAGESPQQAAQRFVAMQAGVYREQTDVLYWEGHNEPSFGAPFDDGAIEKMRWYGEFEAERVRLLAQMGKRAVIANFSTGYPEVENDNRLWEAFLPALRAAHDHKGMLGLHEYGGPFMWSLWGPFEEDNCGRLPSEQGNEGWLALRYRKVHNQILRPNGLGKLPIVITECGTDRVGTFCEPMISGGWHDLVEAWRGWDGSTDPIDYWRGTQRDPELYYAEQLLWYDRQMQQDPYCVGACIFTLGNFGPPWADFEIGGTKVIERILERIEADPWIGPGDPWAVGGSAEASPAGEVVSRVITRPPDEPPADGEDSTPGGLPLGDNLLRNASFEAGAYHWNNIAEVEIPNEWGFWFAPHTTPLLPRQDQQFDRPECKVWRRDQVRPWESAHAFVAGEHGVVAFGTFKALWFRYFQDVAGLTTGQRYRLTVPVFPDLAVAFTERGERIWAPDPLSGEVRLLAEAGSAVVADTGYIDGTGGLNFGQYNILTLDFTASQPGMRLVVECRGRWGLRNNTWYLDGLSLAAQGGAVTPDADGDGSDGEPGSDAGTVAGTGVGGAGNLLFNHDFTRGLTPAHPALRNTLVPSGWALWFAGRGDQRLPGQRERWREPNAYVVDEATATDDDRDALSNGIRRAYAVVGPWRAVWWALRQQVGQLATGRRYRLSAIVYPDPVVAFDAGGRKQHDASLVAGEVWLRVLGARGQTETAYVVNRELPVGRYSRLMHEFVATDGEAEMRLEVRARNVLTLNAWYVAEVTLDAL